MEKSLEFKVVEFVHNKLKGKSTDSSFAIHRRQIEEWIIEFTKINSRKKCTAGDYKHCNICSGDSCNYYK